MYLSTILYNGYSLFFRVALGYEGKKIKDLGSGTDYEELLALFGGNCIDCIEIHFNFNYSTLLLTDGDRIYAYVRFETGDEMSRRAKFAFITWIGPSVSPLKKAKVSTDKAFVKAIFVVSETYHTWL